MSMYEQDKWQREYDNGKKLMEMKIKAGKQNDVVTFNAINMYERSYKDATLLLKMIQRMNLQIKAYERFEGEIEHTSHKVQNDRVESALEKLNEELREINV